MNITTTTKGFREVIRDEDVYDAPATFKREDIPEGCSVTIEAYASYQNVCIYRDHPFNEQVLATRAEKTLALNLRGDTSPARKFNIDGWTPAKLAQMQTQAEQRAVDYKAATLRIEAATKAHIEAFDAQLKQLKGEST